MIPRPKFAKTWKWAKQLAHHQWAGHRMFELCMYSVFQLISCAIPTVDLQPSLSNAMVTYSLRHVCGGRTATLISQTAQRPYGFYANRTATSHFLPRRKVIAILAFFLTSHKTFFRNRNAATTPQGQRMVALQCPWGGIYGFCPVLSAEKIVQRPHGVLVVASRRPYGGRTAILW